MSRIRDSLRRAQDAGWTTTKTSGGHLKLLHPDASVPVFTTANSSDHRSEQNLQAQLRRVLSPPETRKGDGGDVATARSSTETVGGQAPAALKKAKPTKAASPPPKPRPAHRFTMPIRSPEELPQADIEVKPPPIVPSPEAVRAWALHAMRLRCQGIEVSTLRAIRNRFRSDYDFHELVLRNYRHTPEDEIASLRADFRAGRIVPLPLVPVAPRDLVVHNDEAEATKAEPTLTEDPIVRDAKAIIAQLNANLQEEQHRRSKAVRELADLRARSLNVEMASAEIRQQKEVISVLEETIKQANANLEQVQSERAALETGFEQRLDRIDDGLGSMTGRIEDSLRSMTSQIENGLRSMTATLNETLIATLNAVTALQQPVPGQATPKQATPKQATPKQAVPEQAIPEQAVPEQETPTSPTPASAKFNPNKPVPPWAWSNSGWVRPSSSSGTKPAIKPAAKSSADRRVETPQPLYAPSHGQSKKPAPQPSVVASAAMESPVMESPVMDFLDLPSRAEHHPDAPSLKTSRRPVKPAVQPVSKPLTKPVIAPAARSTMGQRIREARQDCNLSQIELAEMVHVSGTTVSFWERDKSTVRQSYMQALARSLNVTEQFLRNG